jgi:hypothetical protein
MQSLPPAISIKVYEEEGITKALIIDQELQVLRVELQDSFKVESVMNLIEVIENSGTMVRSYDKVVNFVHFNPSTNSLYVSFLN